MKSGRSTSFTDLLPTPRFLEMPSVGLDISDEAIRVVELKRHGSQFKLGIYGEERIAKDIVEEGGYIKDKAKLTDVLRTIQKKYNLHFIKASLAEEKSYIFKTEVPLMDEADIRGALQFKIEENVPVALVDAIYDYRIIETGEKAIKVSVTVVHTKVMTNYLEVFRDAHLVPLELHIESQAIAHAAIPHDATGTYIIVAIRANRTILAIVSDGDVQFTSTLHVGGESIAESIKKNFNVDEQQAEKIRQGKEVRESNEMFLSLVNAASALRDEVQKLIAYWDSHSHEHGHANKNIEKVIVSGSDALLGLDTYIGQSLSIKVEIANPWINILEIHSNLPQLTLREALDYLPALGLALPYD